jgi:hypothetical protein
MITELSFVFCCFFLFSLSMPNRLIFVDKGDQLLRLQSLPEEENPFDHDMTQCTSVQDVKDIILACNINLKIFQKNEFF